MARVKKKKTQKKKTRTRTRNHHPIHSHEHTHTHELPFTISPLVEALELLLGHLPAEHHLTDRLRRLHQTQKKKKSGKANEHAFAEQWQGLGRRRRGTWCGRRLGGGVAPAASSWAAPSGHVSRSAVDVWDFLTGAGLSISPSRPPPPQPSSSSLSLSLSL